MSTNLPLASRPAEVRSAATLAAIGAWTIIVPYLGDALGLGVTVPPRVEVVDHTVPGVLVVATGLYLHRLARRQTLAGQRFALPAAGVCFLAGFWVLVTHIPLLGDAATADQPWGPAIWHSIAALPVVGVGFWCALRASSNP